MSRITPAYWYVSSNVGDNLTPWLLRKMGQVPCYTPIESRTSKLLMSGSILAHADGASHAWGVGLGSIEQSVHPDARLHAVRGPLSRMRAVSCGVSCPEIYGDSGLLVPQFYQPEGRGGASVGLIPHYVDQARVFQVYESHDVRLINILDSVEEVVDQITSCDLVVSSALHGIILAVAYGVPFVWAKFSDNVLGHDFKFIDFFLSLNMMPACMDLRGDTLPEVPAFRSGPIVVPPGYSTAAFVEACPLNGLEQAPQAPTG